MREWAFVPRESERYRSGSSWTALGDTGGRQRVGEGDEHSRQAGRVQERRERTNPVKMSTAVSTVLEVSLQEIRYLTSTISTSIRIAGIALSASPIPLDLQQPEMTCSSLVSLYDVQPRSHAVRTSSSPSPRQPSPPTTILPAIQVPSQQKRSILFRCHPLFTNWSNLSRLLLTPGRPSLAFSIAQSATPMSPFGRPGTLFRLSADIVEDLSRSAIPLRHILAVERPGMAQ
jgi:hypothetical protein